MASYEAVRFDGMSLRPNQTSARRSESTPEALTGTLGPLDEYTVDELKSYAKDNDIDLDLDGATRKADIIAAIEAAGNDDAT